MKTADQLCHESQMFLEALKSPEEEYAIMAEGAEITFHVEKK